MPEIAHITVVLTTNPEPPSGAAPLTVSFTGTASTDQPDRPITRYALRFGDGLPDWTSDSPPSGVSHTYSTQGNYTAILTATDSQEATGSASLNIQVQPPLGEPLITVELTANPTWGVTSLQVSFAGSATTDQPNRPIAEYSLRFGDESANWTSDSPPSNVVHTYSSAGSFAAVLTATDSEGATGQDSINIEVLPSIDLSGLVLDRINPRLGIGEAQLYVYVPHRPLAAGVRQGTEPFASTASAEDGSYSLMGLPSGDLLHITVDPPPSSGYAGVELDLTFSGAGLVRLDIKLPRVASTQ